MPLSDGHLVELLHEIRDRRLPGARPAGRLGLSGTRAGQHRSDLAADEAALEVLRAADVGVLSEESGLHAPERDLIVVVDPLDSSTKRGPASWFATSLCAVDRDGPRVSLVIDLPHGRAFTAVRRRGSSVDGVSLVPTGCTALAEAVVGISGLPPESLGWRQFRALGAVALDLCAVAEERSTATSTPAACRRTAHGTTWAARSCALRRKRSWPTARSAAT